MNGNKSILSRRSVKGCRLQTINEELEMIHGCEGICSLRREQTTVAFVVMKQDELIKIKKLSRKYTLLRRGKKTPSSGDRSSYLIIVFFFQADGAPLIHTRCTYGYRRKLILPLSLGIGSNWIFAVVKIYSFAEESQEERIGII